MDTVQLQQQIEALHPWGWVAIAVAVLVLGLLVVLLVRRRRRRRSLRDRYGAEYEHTARRAGSRRRADRELVERESQRRTYEVRELTAGERERLHARWEALQTSFVDDPWAAARGLDELIAEAAVAKGYPEAEDDPLGGVSVDHPQPVDRYRAAGRGIEEGEQARATTEQLRRAVLAARDLFETLVGSERTAAPGTRTPFRALVEEDDERVR